MASKHGSTLYHRRNPKSVQNRNTKPSSPPVNFFVILRQGEKWRRLRKALAPKMLRPKGILENLDNFNGVARDTISHMASLRGIGDEILDLEGELSKFATECKS